MASKKQIDPAAGIKQDPATSWITHEERSKTETSTNENERFRFNIYVKKKDEETYKDFAIYAKDIGMNVSALLAEIMKQIVDANREQIEEAKQRHARAQQKKYE